MKLLKKYLIRSFFRWLGQKSLKQFRQNDDTKATFRNELTFSIFKSIWAILSIFEELFLCFQIAIVLHFQLKSFHNKLKKMVMHSIAMHCELKCFSKKHFVVIYLYFSLYIYKKRNTSFAHFQIKLFKMFTLTLYKKDSELCMFIS